jgi:carboxyl-terminal processing protease
MRHQQHRKLSNKRPLIKWIFILGLGIWIGNLLPKSNLFFLNDLNLQKSTHKFHQILTYIKQDYVDTTNLEGLTEIAIGQLIEQLDPHSSYINAEEQTLVSAELEGEFFGIGIEFVLMQDTIYIIAPISGGPAEKAGIQPGDQIIRVNGQNWAGQNIKTSQILKQIRGTQGSQVTVSIQRNNHQDLLDFTLTRDKIHTHSVDAAYMVDQEIGYLKLSRFSSRTYEEFMAALASLKDQGMKRLLLDLRSNPGGYLDQTVKIIEQMLEADKLIVYTQGKISKYNTKYYSKGKNNLDQIPIIVLINEGSASASEILAGALQDHDRALIVGRRSFGKGLVQRPIQLSDSSQLRLTVARYYTPSGRFIQKPYDQDQDDYQLDLVNRYARGEYFHADSIHFDDSLQYKTAAGRTVYGGGGIMPDYFVALDTTLYNTYIEQLLGKYVLQQCALEYAQVHKESLSNMSYAIYYENFTITPAMLVHLNKQAQAAGIAQNKQVLSQSQTQIKLLLKAYIARNIWKEQGFYGILNQEDKIFKQAMQLFGEAANLIKDPPATKPAP